MIPAPVTNIQGSIADIWHWLEQVVDPEIPVLTVLDMGVVRRIVLKSGNETVESTLDGREYAGFQFRTDAVDIQVDITPTYTGCPAMNMIAANIRLELLAHGIEHTSVREVLTPAWTTDWMSAAAKEKLKEYGIAPPQAQKRTERLLFAETKVACPHCGSENTEQISAFGSTACKALYRCLDCREPFDYFKCH